MRVLRRSTAILLSFLAAACSNGTIPVEASTGVPPGELRDAQGSGSALKVDLPGRMSVLVQVVSTEGQPVANLSAGNFRLYEDSVLVSATESQQRLLPRPRVFRNYAHLLLDISGSVAQTPGGLESEIQAALRFVDEVTAAPENHVAVSWFFGGSEIAPAVLDNLTPLGFTDDRDKLREAIQNVDLIQVTSTSTNLYGAVISGLTVLDDVLLQGENDGIEFLSLTLVTFTDGTDQAGLWERADAIARLENGPNDYSAMTIGLGSEIDPEVLAALGPDGFRLAQDSGALDEVFAAVGRDVSDLANSFYLVGYISPKLNGSGLHTLTVEAFANGGVASRDYEFNARYFSGGGGFIDVRDLPVNGVRLEASRLALAPDGGFFGTGSTEPDVTGQTRAAWVTRTLADGRMDAGFGQGGVRTIASLGAFQHLSPAAILAPAADRVWVLLTCAQSASDPATRAGIIRLGPGTALDFYLLDPPTVEPERGVDLAMDGQGRLLALSVLGEWPETRTVVRRLVPTTLNLGLDASFGVLGSAVFAANSTELQESPAALAVGSTGRSIIAGSGWNSAANRSDMQLARLTPGGNLDPAFGTGGFVHHQGTFASAGIGRVWDVAVDGAGRVLAVGELDPSSTFAHPRAAWWRVLENGTPDASFTGNAANPFLGTGLVTLGSPLTGDPEVLFGDASRALATALASNGASLSAGLRRNARGDQDLCFWRLSPAGLFSQSYNATGFLLEDGTASEASDERVSGLAIGADGVVHALGSSTTPATQLEAGRRSLVLWRDVEPGRVFVQ